VEKSKDFEDPNNEYDQAYNLPFSETWDELEKAWAIDEPASLEDKVNNRSPFALYLKCLKTIINGFYESLFEVENYTSQEFYWDEETENNINKLLLKLYDLSTRLMGLEDGGVWGYRSARHESVVACLYDIAVRTSGRIIQICFFAARDEWDTALENIETQIKVSIVQDYSKRINIMASELSKLNSLLQEDALLFNQRLYLGEIIEKAMAGIFIQRPILLTIDIPGNTAAAQSEETRIKNDSEQRKDAVPPPSSNQSISNRSDKTLVFYPLWMHNQTKTCKNIETLIDVGEIRYEYQDEANNTAKAIRTAMTGRKDSIKVEGNDDRLVKIMDIKSKNSNENNGDDSGGKYIVFRVGFQSRDGAYFVSLESPKDYRLKKVKEKPRI
jgi:hypothetical protein